MALILKRVGRRAAQLKKEESPKDKARKGLVTIAARCARWANPDSAESALAEFSRKANNFLANKTAEPAAAASQEEAYMAILLGTVATEPPATEVAEVATAVAAIMAAAMPTAIMTKRLETKEAYQAFFGLVAIRIEEGVLDPVLNDVFREE